MQFPGKHTPSSKYTKMAGWVNSPGMKPPHQVSDASRSGRGKKKERQGENLLFAFILNLPSSWPITGYYVYIHRRQFACRRTAFPCGMGTRPLAWGENGNNVKGYHNTLCLRWPREHILHIPDLITTGQKAKERGIILSAVTGKPNELRLLQQNTHKCTSILNQSPSMRSLLQLLSIRPPETGKKTEMTLMNVIYLSSMSFKIH